MTAGRGVRHSEYNASDRDDVHLLQIWIQPAAKGLEPGYQKGVFDDGAKRDRLRLIASPEGRDGSLPIHQDALLFASVISPDTSLSHPLAAGRGAWVQVVAGALSLNGVTLSAGDGAAVEDEAVLTLATGMNGAEVLLFDLA